MSTTVLPASAAPLAPTAPPPPPAPPTIRRLVGEQTAVMAAQAASGLGNFAFLLVALRMVSARGFAQLATFLALYLVLLMPTLGLSAGAVVNPAAARRAARRWTTYGVAAALVLSAAAVGLAPVLHMPVSMLVVLALALPGAGPLALARGRLYAVSRAGAVSATLVAEPVARLAVGLPLLAAIGPIGGTLGVAVAGYAGLAVGWVALRRPPRRPASVPPPAAHAVPPSTGLPRVTVAAFVLLAVVQNQDVVFANGLLPAAAAGTFAALSTLGGIAAFATATMPLVLLPRAGVAGRAGVRATRVAVTAAVAIGVAAILAAVLVPRSVFSAVLGARYADVASLAGLYLAAMSLLGVARVLAARLIAQRRGGVVLAVTAVAVAMQALCLVLAVRTPTAVAACTFLATAVLVGGMVAAPWLQRRGFTTSLRQAGHRRIAMALTALSAAALAVRLVITRGLWLDEATSVTQAHMHYGAMLRSLRTTDVHPPAYFTVLWGWVRIFGSGPLSVRMPSILLATALVPALYFCGRELFDSRSGLVAAALGVVAPQMVWYGQEARMYALFMLLVTLSVATQARALRSGDRRWWLAHGALCGLLFATQYFSVLVVLTQHAVTALLLARQRRRGAAVRRQLVGWAWALGVMLLLMLPLVPFAYDQFAANQAAGRGFGASASTTNAIVQPGTHMSPYVLIANLLWAGWGYHSATVMTDLGALWPLGMLLLLALLGRGRSRASVLALAVALVPIAALYAIGTEKRFLFDLRYFIGCVPMLVLLTARAASTWPRTRHGSAVLAGLVGLSFLAGLADQQINGRNPRRYDFEPALHRIAVQAAPTDQVILAPSFLNDLSRYYQPQLRTVPAQGQPAAVVRRTTPDRHVFLLGSFFDVGGRQECDALLGRLRQHRHLVTEWRFANVKVWEFE